MNKEEIKDIIHKVLGRHYKTIHIGKPIEILDIQHLTKKQIENLSYAIAVKSQQSQSDAVEEIQRFDKWLADEYGWDNMYQKFKDEKLIS